MAKQSATPHVPNDSRDVARELDGRLAALRDARRPFDPVWDEVARYMGPSFAGFTAEPEDPARALTPDEHIVETAAATRAALIFSAGMLSGLSSPSSRWFSLTLDDQDLAQRPEVRAWLTDLEDGFYRTLAASDYYSQQHLAYHQSGLFGWQCLYVDESPQGGIRWNARPLNELYIAESFQGAVDTAFRVFRLTARQAAQKWGRDNLSSQVRDALDRKGGEGRRFPFLHAVFPKEDAARNNRDTGGPNAGGPGLAARGQGLAFASWYVDLTARQVVSRGGYAQLPFIVTRAYRLPGTAYSCSPGTQALADVKMVNEMKRLILQAGQLTVAPPYLVPDDGFVGRFSFEPRAMNYYRKAEGNLASDFTPLSVGGDPRFSWELLKASRTDIQEAFFTDLFLAVTTRINQGAAPTALEVAELAGERMFLLGPMLIRQQHENFDALFARLLALKRRRGELPPEPAEVHGKSLRLEYVSPLALAQRAGVVPSVLETYADAASIAQAAPQVMDNMDHDAALRRIMAARGFPLAAIRPEDEVRALREQAQMGRAAMAAAAQPHPQPQEMP